MGFFRSGWVALIVLVVACTPGATTDSPSQNDSSPNSSNTASTASTASGSVAEGPANSGATTDTLPAGASDPGSGDCPPGEGTRWTNEASSQAVRILERDDGLTVDLVEYPLPGYEGRPWSQWGQGLVVDNGRFISAVGDHHGVNGNSFFFEFDPSTATLTRISDVLSHTDHQSGDFGYGKVHAQMVAGPCGEVYAHTYWGSRRNLEYGDGYRGDLLFRIDPASEVIELLGVTEEERGTPSMAGSPDGRLLFLEAVEPETNQTDLVVYDVFERATIDTIVDPNHTGRRALAVSSEGSVFYSTGNGELAVYDPLTREVTDTGASIPGTMLRATTTPGPDGTIVAVSSDPDEFFTIDPEGNVELLGEAPGYTASLAMSPDGQHVYLIPGAHGNSWEQGTPVVDLDPTTGRQETLVELAKPVEEAVGVRTGGTYNIVLDPGGERLYIGLNVGEGDETFGRVFLVIIELPT